eukprot:Trichotokara_eunicae@DN4625_c0_g1_i1.p1
MMGVQHGEGVYTNGKAIKRKAVWVEGVRRGDWRDIKVDPLCEGFVDDVLAQILKGRGLSSEKSSRQETPSVLEFSGEVLDELSAGIGVTSPSARNLPVALNEAEK